MAKSDEILNYIYNKDKKLINAVLQDKRSEVVDIYMTNLDDAITPTLTQGQSIDDQTITVDDATGVLGTGVHAINISENGRTFQAIVTNVAGNVITFNAPLDMNITVDAVVQIALWNMNINGSVTKKYFSVSPPTGAKWDITRIIIGMTGESAMDDSTFGNLASLTNGVVLRRINGVLENIFVVQNNGGFAERCYDTEYPTKVPAGIYAFRARRTFAGQEKNGVVIRLDGDSNDRLEFIINDDLSDASFTKFACVVQGNVVEEY